MALVDVKPGLINTSKNVADYSGAGLRGVEQSLSLDHAKIEVKVRYRGRHGFHILTVDVTPATPTSPLEVLLLCPRCQQQLRIASDRKAIEFLPNVPVKIVLDSEEVIDGDASDLVSLGQLSIEPFECTWELNPQGRRMEFGLGLCKWKVGIDKNVAKDA